jgi:hypothetical protein
MVPGVKCRVYSFENDTEKDLGIIDVDRGCKTPLQKVLQGDKTIEGYISGKGKLIITNLDRTKVEYAVDQTTPRNPLKLMPLLVN